MLTVRRLVALLCLAAPLLSCSTDPDGTGPEGTPGPAGPQGPQGPAGMAAATPGSRLKPYVVSGPDGSRFQLGIWDSQRKEVCRFDTAEDGQLRCLPEGPFALASGGFSDPTCSTRLFIWPGGPGNPCAVKYARDNALQCSPGRIYTLSPFTGGVVYIADGAACRQVTKSADFFNAIPVPPTDFAAGQIEP